MASIDMTGQEKEISEFLQKEDLIIRADPKKTSELKELIEGPQEITDESIFLQHGGKLEKGCLQISLDSTIGKVLLRTAQDAVQNINYSLKKKGNLTEITIMNKNPTCFKFIIPTNEI